LRQAIAEVWAATSRGYAASITSATKSAWGRAKDILAVNVANGISNATVMGANLCKVVDDTLVSNGANYKVVEEWMVIPEAHQ
jgi:hypothetical protein